MERGTDVSVVLPALLLARGLTQAQLAEMTGIRREDVNAYCKGRKRLGVHNGRKIAKALGLDTDFFTQPTGPPQPALERIQQRVEALLKEIVELRQHSQEGS